VETTKLQEPSFKNFNCLPSEEQTSGVVEERPKDKDGTSNE
jgi:hypothetical protein